MRANLYVTNSETAIYRPRILEFGVLPRVGDEIVLSHAKEEEEQTTMHTVKKVIHRFTGAIVDEQHNHVLHGAQVIDVFTEQRAGVTVGEPDGSFAEPGVEAEA